MKRRNIKFYNILQLSIGLSVIILINVIARFVFSRFDLTTEKRYTLSDVTKKMLRNLDDVVYFKVYLEGEFPAGFKRLHDETKEMLDEFRAYGGDNIQYEFVNPLEGIEKDPKASSDVVKQLVRKGIQPTSLSFKEKDENTQKVIFPGALVTYKGRELSVQILKSQIGAHPEAMLNNSVKDLEYELANVIRKLYVIDSPRIAFLTGHGELEEPYVADITKSLREYYKVERVKIKGQLNSLRPFKALIIAQPDSAFDEKDKFVIDQYIMKGGKVLWLVESTFATMDSLGKSGETVGLANPINLEDQLFKYGVRINTNFVQDIQGAPIPIVTGYTGNQPQTQLFPWYFFPMVFPVDKHPIVKNLNAIRLEFANTIDTVGLPGIKKSILLRTSKYARILNTPTRISLNSIRKEPEEKEFNKSYLPIGVLLEGKFESVFKNRVPQEVTDSKEIAFKPQCDSSNKMIVVADGDVIKNGYNVSKGTVYPLGYDKYTQEEYGNKNFILNCINYLCDDAGLIDVRAREIKLRLLDRTKVDTEQTKWKFINVAVPIGLVLLFGVALNNYRKKKYAGK